MEFIQQHPEELADVPSQTDTRKRSTQRVRATSIRLRFRFLSTKQSCQNIVGNWGLYSSPSENKRGMHMSRLMEIRLETEKALPLESLGVMWDHIRSRLEVKDAFLSVQFRRSVEKHANLRLAVAT